MPSNSGDAQPVSSGRRTLLALLVSACMAAAGIMYYSTHREEFHLITSVSAGAVAALALSHMAVGLCNSLPLKILTDHYGLDLKFSQWYGLVRLTTFANLWMPSGAALSARALYLKRFHELPYHSFAAMTGLASVLRLLVAGLLGLLFLLFGTGGAQPALMAFAAGITVFMIIILLFAGRIRNGRLAAIRVIRVTGEEWDRIHGDRRALIGLLTVNAFMVVFSGIEVYFSFRAFSLHVPFTVSSALAAFMVVSGVVKILPGNFGVKEAVIIGLSGLSGIGVNEALHAAALMRVNGIAWNLLLVPFFAHSLLQGRSHRDEAGNRQSLS